MLGFDFDGTAFTHIDDKIAFGVQSAGFGFGDDQDLVKLGTLVHALDVGDVSNPEAASFGAIITGAKSRPSDDDTLLAEIGTVLDSLHAHYNKENRT